MRKMYSRKQIELMAKGIADAVAEGFLEDVIEGAEAGTLVNLLGLDSDGGLKKQAVDEAVVAVVAGAEAGTIQDVLGLDENGDLVKGSAGGDLPFEVFDASVDFPTPTTIQQFCEKIGLTIRSFSSGAISIYVKGAFEGNADTLYNVSYVNYGSLELIISSNGKDCQANYKYTSLSTNLGSGTDKSRYYLPVLPSDTTKNYVLRRDGALLPEWVEVS